MKKILFSVVYCCLVLLSCSNSNGGPLEDDGWDNETNINLVIMSYNIRHCAPYYGSSESTQADVSGLANVIKQKKPDVALLQEVDSCTTRSLGVDQIVTLAKLAGYEYYYYFKQKDLSHGSYGAGILSKYELKDIVNQPLPKVIDGQTITGSNILGTARITFNHRDIYIATMHLSVTESERNKQFPYYLERLNTLNGPVIVGGDFNSKPDDGIISIFDSDGWIRTNNDPNKFTIPSTTPNREIDYIAYKASTSFKVISHTVGTGINASDHLPIISVLKPLD